MLGEWGQAEVAQNRQFTGQSVKVKVPKVKVSCIEIGVQGSGNFFPLGQAKKLLSFTPSSLSSWQQSFSG